MIEEPEDTVSHGAYWDVPPDAIGGLAVFLNRYPKARFKVEDIAGQLELVVFADCSVDGLSHAVDGYLEGFRSARNIHRTA